MRERRRWLVLLAVLVGAQLVWGARYIERTSFVHGDERVFCLWDDAMISMRYARNLRLGNGLVWNAEGERIQGFSNPVATLAMAGLHFLPLSPRRVALAFQVLQLLLLAGMLPFAYGLARRVFPDRPPVAAAQ